MKLQTTVSVKRWSQQLKYEQPLVLMGSCFTENIGSRLANAGYHTSLNPFGITFNPISISEGISNIIEGRLIAPEELVEREGLWQHWDFHSSQSGLDRVDAAASMSESIRQGGEHLRSASHLMITLGTAWVYELVDAQRHVVNNCHKFPAAGFARRRLSVEEISSAFDGLLKKLKHYNPGLAVVFTLSPVRHWKDGAEENSISKATLRLAIEAICTGHAECSYFPAYELMMDELRDYRFYADDLLHPNSMAQAIIWERFIQAAVTEHDQSIAREVQAYHRMLAHRSLHPGSSADQSFKESIESRRKELEGLYPHACLA